MNAELGEHFGYAQYDPAGYKSGNSRNMDAFSVKMRHNGRVKNRAMYAAIGINMEGVKEGLGLWARDNEGAKFWLREC